MEYRQALWSFRWTPERLRYVPDVAAPERGMETAAT